jgi:hypothetical protein
MLITDDLRRLGSEYFIEPNISPKNQLQKSNGV